MSDASHASTPLLDDQPSNVDLLNFAQFVDALSAVILDPQTKTPIIMGVFGRWGTGKSTLMRMLQGRLEARKLQTVWFNAWLYSKEDEIWAALLQSLMSTLSRTLTWRQKIRFALGLHDRGIDASQWMMALPRVLVTILGVLIPLLAGYLLSLLFPTETGRTVTQLGGLGASLALFYGTVLRPAAQLVRERIGADFTLYKSLDFQSHIGFLDRFRTQFAHIVEAVPGGQHVVVFIDDLDRCGADKALEVLDTIKVFLDVPGCVFVLGVDIAVLQRALEKKYPDDAVAQGEYLSKIVQLPFHLPPLMDADLRGYVEKLDVRFPDDRCREVMLGGLARNPRELKRVINTYALQWYLARARSGEGDVTPVRLAKIVVIQQSFARLFGVLRDQPSLLGVFERALRATLRPASDPLAMLSGPGYTDAALDAITVVQTPGGLALPPSLLPFAEDAAIRRLLTMHDADVGDDVNFSALSEEQLLVYFNLTHRFQLPNATVVAAPVPQSLDDLFGVAPSQVPPVMPSPMAPASVRESPASQAPIEIDFGSRYAVIERLAFGGSSEVYLAEDRTTKARVAIKRLLSSLSDDPNWTARFEREIRILLDVGVHPNIAGVVDSGSGRDRDGRAFRFMAMEHVAGDSLQALLASRAPLPLPELGTIFVPILDALAFLHARGIVHRDIKPSSIVITAARVPKLIDFGLAVEHARGRDDLTSVGTIVGTPAYMSPEQLSGQTFGPASDLFSLGLVLVEAATGINPVKSERGGATLRNILLGDAIVPSRLRSDLSPAFDAFVARLLSPKPEDRWPDAAAARVAFERVVADAA